MCTLASSWRQICALPISVEQNRTFCCWSDTTPIREKNREREREIEYRAIEAAFEQLDALQFFQNLLLGLVRVAFKYYIQPPESSTRKDGQTTAIDRQIIPEEYGERWIRRSWRPGSGARAAHCRSPIRPKQRVPMNDIEPCHAERYPRRRAHLI
jgi:hypothetical protein